MTCISLARNANACNAVRCIVVKRERLIKRYAALAIEGGILQLKYMREKTKLEVQNPTRHEPLFGVVIMSARSSQTRPTAYVTWRADLEGVCGETYVTPMILCLIQLP